jgi:transposase-like protein
VVIDGSKGLRAAVKRALGKRAVVQRCQWHKRENVLKHLSKGEQAAMRRRLQRAYEKPTYQEAKAALNEILRELEQRNLSAARSLEEGLEETLTLHRLGVFGPLSVSLKTTNCIESIFSQVETRCRKVSHWKNASQKHRWLAASLLDIEPRLRRIRGYRHLPLLREAIQKALGIAAQQQVA